MTAEGILSCLRRKPFIPFRLHLSAGTSHDVLHPEMTLVTKIGIIIAIHDPDQVIDDIPARDVLVSYLDVTSVEDLPLKSRAAG